MALAKRDEGKKVNSDINVTPMVDVMLVLLIIFMVITPMSQHGISAHMAVPTNQRATQHADKEDALLVALTRGGESLIGSVLLADADAQSAKQQLSDACR